MANHTENDAQLVDRMTREPIDFIEMDDFLFFILLAYSSISETGRHRASIGKRIMGIEVVDERGATMTWRRALGRNIGKFLFAFLFVVGFMMASWTDL